MLFKPQIIGFQFTVTLLASSLAVKINDGSVGELKQPGFDTLSVFDCVQVLIGFDQYLLLKIIDIIGVTDFGMKKGLNRLLILSPDIFKF